MFEKQIYDAEVRFQISRSIQTNEQAKAFWQRMRDAWLDNASMGRINQKPAPPALVQRVVALPWQEGMEQAAITLTFGPDLVDDPTCELHIPEPPVPGLPGDVDVGDLMSVGPPIIYWCGLRDRAAPGTRAEKDGHQLVKHSGFTRWYQGV